ncbi:hypothetical protein [Citreimonas salinaria]|nr:hypothetical protein [Citreimonas salinaria]
MQTFFEPVIGVDALDETLRIFRPLLLETNVMPGGTGAFDDVSVSHRKSGNDAAGDAVSMP